MRRKDNNSSFISMIDNTLRYTYFEVVFASPAGYFLVLSWKAGKAE